MDKIEKEMYEMIQILNEWTKAYDEGHPVVSDKEWDELYFELKKLEDESGIALPGSPTGKISYEVKSELKKVKHNHKMLSLDKTKDWDEFINYFNKLSPKQHKDVIAMLKLDGLTCSLKYVNGELVSAETRGDGEIGEDILHNAKVVKSIPQRINYKEELILDGEMICTYQDFEFFSEEYKNPRNFASGSIRLLDSKECKERNLTFVVWNVVKGFDEYDSFFRRLTKVEELGFYIVPCICLDAMSSQDELISAGKKAGYPIDGLVGRFDDIAFGNSLGETEHHIRAAYAYKFYDEEYETTLEDIEWSAGRTGVFTPVAIFNAVDDGVSTITRASLHNLSVLTDTLGKKPYRGQKIWVAKVNMIIPQIMRADTDHGPENSSQYIKMPLRCPFCDELLEIETSNSGVRTVHCTNNNCEGKLSTHIDHFLGKKGLDAKGISRATIDKLIEWGWISSIEDVFKLDAHREEWIKKPGFGIRSVDKILESIKTASNCSLDKFICAIGIPLIGEKYAKIIVKNEKTWDKFRQDVDSKFEFYDWVGFGVEMSDAILKFNFSLADSLIKNGYITFKEPEAEKQVEQNLSGKKVVITGSLKLYKNRTELKNKIEAHGGQVIGSVSKNTDILISNDVNSTSSKCVTAKKLEIPILTEEDFNKLYFDFIKKK